MTELTIIDSKTNYWRDMSLLEKNWAVGYKIQIFKRKKDNIWVKLLYELNIKMKILNENRVIEYK